MGDEMSAKWKEENEEGKLKAMQSGLEERIKELETLLFELSEKFKRLYLVGEEMEMGAIREEGENEPVRTDQKGLRDMIEILTAENSQLRNVQLRELLVSMEENDKLRSATKERDATIAHYKAINKTLNEELTVLNQSFDQLRQKR